MPRVEVTTAQGADNESVFELVDSDGVAIDLTALGATRVTVEVCGGRYSCSSKTISSDTDAVTYSGNTVTAKLGHLELARGEYFPKMAYFTPSESGGVVVAAQGWYTEIVIKAVC